MGQIPDEITVEEGRHLRGLAVGRICIVGVCASSLARNRALGETPVSRTKTAPLRLRLLFGWRKQHIRIKEAQRRQKVDFRLVVTDDGIGAT